MMQLKLIRSYTHMSVFRQGDVGTNWYAVLSGSLDMNVSETGDAKVSQFTSVIFSLTVHTNQICYFEPTAEAVRERDSIC